MEQLVAIVAVYRLVILKRMPATILTLLVAHRVREQAKVQVQRSVEMKTWGWFANPKGEYTEFSNSILKILAVLLDHFSLQGTFSPLFRE